MTKRIKNKAPTESNIIPEPTPEVKKQSFKILNEFQHLIYYLRLLITDLQEYV